MTFPLFFNFCITWFVDRFSMRFWFRNAPKMVWGNLDVVSFSCPLAPFWLPFGSPRLPSSFPWLPLGSLVFPFGSLWRFVSWLLPAQRLHFLNLAVSCRHLCNFGNFLWQSSVKSVLYLNIGIGNQVVGQPFYNAWKLNQRSKLDCSSLRDRFFYDNIL